MAWNPPGDSCIRPINHRYPTTVNVPVLVHVLVPDSHDVSVSKTLRSSKSGVGRTSFCGRGFSPDTRLPLSKCLLYTGPGATHQPLRGTEMRVRNPTHRTKMTDTSGRPYFLWDLDITLEDFENRLRDPDPEVRAYLTGKLMRQARPDDVFEFVGLREINDLWPLLRRYLGRTRPFWEWVREASRRRRDVA